MRDFASIDTDTYPVIKKSFKIHERPILGFNYYYDSKLDRNVLASVAQDSVKTWAATSFGDELDLMPLQEYTKQRCGSQAYDVLPDGKCIILVDTMNVLHVIQEDEKGNLDGTIIDEGMMQILFCRFTPNKNHIFSINFIHGMQAFDFDGQNVIRKKLDRKSSVSAVNFSPTGKWLAIGFDFGVFEIRNGESWDLCCRVEDAHKKKIRVVEFSHNDEHLLIGCDDKTLSLHAVFELTSSKVRNFSYHLGPILSACFDFSKESSQFCSSSADQKVILWDIDGTALHVFQKCFEEQVVTAVNFSSNGRFLFSGTANGQIIVHKMSKFFEEPPVQEDIEMVEEVQEVKEYYENDEDDEDFVKPDFELSEDENDVGQNLKDFDLSDSDEEEVVKNEEQLEETPISPMIEQEETLMSPTIETHNDDAFAAPESVKSEMVEERENGNISNPASVKSIPEESSSQNHPESPLQEEEVQNPVSPSISPVYEPGDTLTTPPFEEE
uniref:Uncharacterized protein n=1 Tax=Panagrolaimus sp. ES5 TaxID=591445 RepID=A0AC34F2U7_9BILA